MPTRPMMIPGSAGHQAVSKMTNYGGGHDGTRTGVGLSVCPDAVVPNLNEESFSVDEESF